MKCNNCGAEILDGAPNCPNCGAPVLPSAQGFSGSSFGAASDEPSYLKILTFVGAGLVFLGSWFPRIVYYNMAGEKEAAGLFASDGGILKFYALLFIIIAAGSVCLEVLPNLDAVKKLPFYQFYLPALGFIVFILVCTNNTISAIRDVIKLAKSFGSMLGGKVSGGWGIAWYFLLFGLIILTVRAVLGFLNSKNN